MLVINSKRQNLWFANGLLKAISAISQVRHYPFCSVSIIRDKIILTYLSRTNDHTEVNWPEQIYAAGKTIISPAFYDKLIKQSFYSRFIIVSAISFIFTVPPGDMRIADIYSIFSAILFLIFLTAFSIFLI